MDKMALSEAFWYGEKNINESKIKQCCNSVAIHENALGETFFFLSLSYLSWQKPLPGPKGHGFKATGSETHLHREIAPWRKPRRHSKQLTYAAMLGVEASLVKKSVMVYNVKMVRALTSESA